jgi:poly(A) polymerase
MKIPVQQILTRVGEIADQKNIPVYVVGGYVRDQFLKRADKDIDFVVVGDGPQMARAVASGLHARNITIYDKFGTALVELADYKLEFVGARKESYRGDSRKPMVEPADLSADLRRRDFTINAMAIGLNKSVRGELIDPFNGYADLHKGIIRTPLDPEITFKDDPLRIMRGIRFASQLQFSLAPDTKSGMRNAAERLKIISQERITEELLKSLQSAKPSTGFLLLEETGVLQVVFPDLEKLKGVDQIRGHNHKDVFFHTMQVLDNVAKVSDNLYLRYSALIHDIAKPGTKQFIPDKGWTYRVSDAISSCPRK